MNWKFKGTAFIWNIIFCNIINDFTDTFDQLNAYLLDKSINFNFDTTTWRDCFKDYT